MNRIDHTSPFDCRNCGGPEMLRRVSDEGDELECIRCGLPPSPDISAIRHALGRAWGVVADLRSRLNADDRATKMPGRRGNCTRAYK